MIDWQRNGTFLKEKGYFTDLIGDDAVRIIERQDPKKPFFLYFASLAPHAPYQATDRLKALYPGIQDKNRRAYAGIISGLDGQIGRIVSTLEKKGLRENTIIQGWTARRWRKGAGLRQLAGPPAGAGRERAVTHGRHHAYAARARRRAG